MKIAVLGNPQSWYAAQIERAARERGHLCSRVEFPLLTAAVWETATRISAASTSLQDLDAVVVRTMPPGSLEQVVFRMDVLQQLQLQGSLIVNSPRAIEAAVDKFLTTSRLAAAGLPTPRTVVCESTAQALAAFEHLGGDVVVKPLFGAEGRGILRVSDQDLAQRVFRTLERTQSVLYLQEFIAHSGFDLRLLVLNGQVLGAIQRRHPTDFRTNVARQGIASLHQPSQLEQDLARQAAAAVGACFAGIDLLYDPAGRCLVIEVNGVPGWQAFERVTGVRVAETLLDYLEQSSP